LATLSPRLATVRFGAVTFPACDGWIGEDRQLFGGGDALPEKVQLTLHLIETTLRRRQL
jgi:hypothetical protein